MAIPFSSTLLLSHHSHHPPPPPLLLLPFLHFPSSSSSSFCHCHHSSCRTINSSMSTSLLSPLLFPNTLPSSIPLEKRICRAASEGDPTPPASPSTNIAKKPEYSLSKGQIVRVDKEKYLNSINYLSVGHPPYYKGLDYIYEDRREVLDIRMFETGEYALIAWAGISTSPAWLPTSMLIKSEKLSYKRM